MVKKGCLRAGLVLLLGVILLGCKGSFEGASDDRETWALRPFYGELRFLILAEGSEVPIPDAALRVANLPVAELDGQETVSGDQDGRLVIHQLERGTIYRGNGPPPPEFIFSAAGYAAQTYSMADLVAGTLYDPYKSVDLPTTLFQSESGVEIELPVFEFTIHLRPAT
jgi:hypothetical protein